jgi:hypothetical protein
MPDEKKYPRASRVSKMADAAVEDMLDFPQSTARGMGRYGLAATAYLPAAAADEAERLDKRLGELNTSRKKETKGMKSGGKVSSASKRADGCAVKGKTRGRII